MQLANTMRTAGFTNPANKLWSIKREWLVSQLDTKKGRKPSKLDRQKKDILIDAAISGALPVLEKRYEDEFRDMIYAKTKPIRIPNKRKRGRTNWKKIEAFVDKKIPTLTTNNHIYAFMKGRRYIYIGQTKNGKWNGGGKWKSENWRKATSIKIFCVKRTMDLSKFECMAIDLFHPELNKKRPPMTYHRTKCPIHQKMWLLEDELKRSFKLK